MPIRFQSVFTVNLIYAVKMSFNRYLNLHYATACNLQREMIYDSAMIQMLRDHSDDVELVKVWMRSYGLFQGISAQKRNEIALAFLKYATTLAVFSGTLDSRAIETHYKDLLLVLYRVVNRSWMSATSKLLWCIYPKDFVIYDAFVHRTLVVLQCLDADLESLPRIHTAPKINCESDVNQAVIFYLNYQFMVRRLQEKNQDELNKLRIKHGERYAYDVRIFDKLLWMIGNPKKIYLSVI